MSSIFRLGQSLRGKLGKYVITKEIQDTVWFARDDASRNFVIKCVRNHSRVENERDVLRRFNGCSPYIRPLLDEIQDPADPPAIVLNHLEDDLWHASQTNSLTRKEVKYVSYRVLKALHTLHGHGFVHTDVKPDNVFIKYGSEEERFSDVQLGDCGSTYHVEHRYAKEGAPIGAPMWRSPEALLQLPWGIATDIWSFGSMIISLLYGGGFNLFNPPGMRNGDEDYELKILMRQFRFFGPFPSKYEEIADPDTVQVILYLMREIPYKDLTNFSRITQREIRKKDKDFILKLMKMDPRDRPSAGELLQDEWFHNS